MESENLDDPSRFNARRQNKSQVEKLTALDTSIQWNSGELILITRGQIVKAVPREDCKFFAVANAAIKTARMPHEYLRRETVSGERIILSN